MRKGRRLLQIVRRGKHGSVQVRRAARLPASTVQDWAEDQRQRAPEAPGQQLLAPKHLTMFASESW